MEEKNVQERAVALYSYLKELSALNSRPVLDAAEYPRVIRLSELAEDTENTSVFYRDRTEEESGDTDPTLVKVRNPELRACPAPQTSFAGWLAEGWDDCSRDAQTLEAREIRGSQVRFDAEEKRVADFEKWREKRTVWAAQRRAAEKTKKLFMALYETYLEANREVETMETVVAEGYLLDRENEAIRHPLLTRRVSVSFDALDNAVYIRDLDVETELYSLALQSLMNISDEAVPAISDDVRENDYHPFDRVGLPGFFTAAARRLSADGIYSAAGIPDGWEKDSRFLIYSNPVIIFRKRINGTPRFIQGVIRNIENTGLVPDPIAETVMGGSAAPGKSTADETVEEQLAAVGGEDPDILLSKEANREQLEIAQRIEEYHAVLVQGPPGTGKTHTIANLMGHFLAEGKSVLVTSHTPKALQVLKDKLPENMQPLCVSVLDDRNTDMERSVDGITSFMAHATANEMKKQSEGLKEQRENLIRELAQTRKKIFEIIRTEAAPLSVNGEEITPSDAAAFVCENADALSYIPGKVKKDAPLPLSYTRLAELYRTNGDLGADEEKEFACGLPAADELESPREFAKLCEECRAAAARRKAVLTSHPSWSVAGAENGAILLNLGAGERTVTLPEDAKLAEFAAFLGSVTLPEEWMTYAAADGKRGGNYALRWEKLIAQIEQTAALTDGIVALGFGKELQSADPALDGACLCGLAKLRELFEKKGKVSKMDFLFRKDAEQAYRQFTVNGQALSSAEDCRLAEQTVRREQMRTVCEKYWNELIAAHGGPAFRDADALEPEQAASARIPDIRTALDFFSGVSEKTGEMLCGTGLRCEDFFPVRTTGTGKEEIGQMLSAVREVLPDLTELLRAGICLKEITGRFDRLCGILEDGSRAVSPLCAGMAEAVRNHDAEAYGAAWTALGTVFAKETLRGAREALLCELAASAPDWAEAVRRREGVHGADRVPENIEEAWRWKQLSLAVSEVAAAPYDELLADSLRLGKRYRELTGEYAEKLAWYHLLKRTECDIDMRQALNGWRLTVRKIGKGTGKTAPKLKAQAKKLMALCQNAVPAWIMPMNRVIESLDPARNRFDVIIVDEASQSDITSLGAMYLGDRLIIVGDDKQVSPMAIGTEIDKTENLEKMYIRDVIPNAHLYGATTSLYDIAATTYRPLMLREHFRCVPDIIGFSNELSYDGKIKPLRDAGSSRLQPAVVLRTVNGVREGKRNEAEAEEAVNLIRQFIADPQYRDSTIGVISLLGDEQANRIYRKILEEISPIEVEKHQILCGNPSHFQGDERDVILLSTVDSPSADGPLAKTEFGAGESMRKRYNVAASRAKDQLWVITSLRPGTDLKPGDIRRRLIEYAMHPQSERTVLTQKPLTPFAGAVSEGLEARGFTLVHQWQVGGYSLETVAVCGKTHVALECDGEVCGGGDIEIRENMERQTILERSGWRFVRLRGSEYYLNPQAATERLAHTLISLGVLPAQPWADAAVE